jgi:ABC-type lipoprotein export system ATPase subunit
MLVKLKQDLHFTLITVTHSPALAGKMEKSYTLANGKISPV